MSDRNPVYRAAPLAAVAGLASVWVIAFFFGNPGLFDDRIATLKWGATVLAAIILWALAGLVILRGSGIK